MPLPASTQREILAETAAVLQPVDCDQNYLLVPRAADGGAPS